MEIWYNDPINTYSLIESLKGLSEEYYDLHAPQVIEEEEPPSAMEFLRNYLSRNIPVIFKNAVRHWPALEKWDCDYISEKLKDQEITVAVTPDGYADAVARGRFVMPEEKMMSFREFSDKLAKAEPSDDTSVYYIQKQNSNFMDEFSCLHEDVELEIPWASEAMGKKPDAVNFWMGDKRAVTSLHKDPYENIYCVVKGRKEFILHSPIDTPWIPYNTYEAGVYSNVAEGMAGLSINPVNDKVRWIPVDPLKPDYEKYPLYKHACNIHCVVEEGDALYLPALWFHHVEQSHGCIAVNYWYDMDFNVNYCHYKFLEEMGNLLYGSDIPL